MFWDLGGQALLRTIWKKYYQECNGFVFAVDASDWQRFEEAAAVFRKLFLMKTSIKLKKRRGSGTQRLGNRAFRDSFEQRGASRGFSQKIFYFLG